MPGKKIVIAAAHRFHLLDLARELELLGNKVKFYSYVPAKRCMQFGLSKNACVFIWPAIPFLLFDKYFKTNTANSKFFKKVIDFFVSVSIKEDDFFIGLSGIYVKALLKAKSLNNTVIVERGSKHILEQKKIVDSFRGTQKSELDFHVIRELESYKLADYIAIASYHVRDSFLVHGFPKEKLFINPYGVDLSMFYPIKEIEKKYDVIMVGGWSYRKGCHLIIDAIRTLNVPFLHVGSIVDLEFPDDPLFTHIDSVDQKELVKYYNQAKVFVLPSLEEGLAMVQMQAISCNLPLVCSKHSGGEDLLNYFGKNAPIYVMENTTTQDLIEMIQNVLGFLNKTDKDSMYDMSGKEQLTWKAYGKRYSDFLDKVITR